MAEGSELRAEGSELRAQSSELPGTKVLLWCLPVLLKIFIFIFIYPFSHLCTNILFTYVYIPSQLEFFAPHPSNWPHGPPPSVEGCAYGLVGGARARAAAKTEPGGAMAEPVAPGAPPPIQTLH